jgi:hypothetical protein
VSDDRPISPLRPCVGLIRSLSEIAECQYRESLNSRDMKWPAATKEASEREIVDTKLFELVFAQLTGLQHGGPYRSYSQRPVYIYWHTDAFLQPNER